jgi:hypothetical protein
MVFSEIIIAYSGRVESLKYEMVNFFYLANLVNRKMEKFRVSKFKKIQIRLVEPDVLTYYDQKIIKNAIIQLFEGITQYWIDFDSSKFLILNKSEKVLAIWNIYKDSLRFYAKEDSWDRESLETIFIEIEKSNCRNEYNLGDFVLNKTKILAGQVQIVFDAQSFRVYGIIKNVLSGKESKQLVLQWEVAKAYSNYILIRKQKWFGDDKFGVKLLNGVEFSVQYIQD